MKRVKLKKVLSARTFLSRLMGLMGRREWPPGAGGLFFPDCGALHTFFTFLKPDLVFMDKSWKILKIISSAGAWRIFRGPRGSAHCLELPRGASKKRGLRAGVIVRF